MPFLGGLVSVVSILRQETYSGQSQSAVEGTVLDAGNLQPLAGVKVSTPDARPRVEPVITDIEGRFKIGGFTTQRRIVPERDGYVFLSRAISSATGIRLLMVREGIIAGRIVDEDGQPHGSGSVSLLHLQYDQYGERRLLQVQGSSYGFFRTVDDQGQYRLFGLLPGDYYIQTVDMKSGDDYYYPGTFDVSKAESVHVGAGEEIQLGALTVPAKKAVRIRFRFKDAPGDLPAERQVYFEPELGFRISGSSGLIRRDEIVSTVGAFGRRDVLVEWRSRAADDGELLFGHAIVDGDSDIDQEIDMKRAFRITTDATLQDAEGKLSFPPNLHCELHSEWQGTFTSSPLPGNPTVCGLSGWIVPTFYRLELGGLPADAYVLSAKVEDQDILANGLQVNGDVHLHILLAAPGSRVEGFVRNANGGIIADAVVALVPDAPLRAAGPLYRTATSDSKGHFELRGIAPAAYHLFAWPELPGTAYRNAEFLKPFDQHGQPVQVEKAGGTISTDVVAF